MRLGCLALAVALGCGARSGLDFDPECSEVDMSTAGAAGGGVAPWHLWGSTQPVIMNLVAGTGVASGQQVARISYKRPDNWTFFFSLVVLDVQKPPPDAFSLDCFFDLTLGVGRSSVTIPGFEHFRFDFPGAVPLGQPLYSTQVIGPPRIPASTAENIIRDFPAQDIQLAVRSIASLGGFGTGSATAAVSGFFSPRTHVRPDWCTGSFAGEQGGH
jgi:hypothetical protein